MRLSRSPVAIAAAGKDAPPLSDRKIPATHAGSVGSDRDVQRVDLVRMIVLARPCLGCLVASEVWLAPYYLRPSRTQPLMVIKGTLHDCIIGHDLPTRAGSTETLVPDIR